MFRMLRSTVSVLLLLTVSLQAQPTEPTSPAARQAKAEYDAAMKKAEAELVAARETYLAKLDAALKQAMTAGDLEEANRIDALRKAARGGGANAVASTPANPQTGDARRKPGWVVGNITDSAGNPIKGVAFEVACFGTTLRGERSSFTLDVDANGHFEQELPDGLYAVTAYVEKDFLTSRFRVQLHPADEKPDQTKLPSKPGILKDFVWKLTGVRPGGDPTAAFAHHGTSARIYDSQYLADDEQKLSARYPGATVVVTFTPRGTMIDGTQGKPIEIKGDIAKVSNTLGHVALDVPIAAYTATARLVTAKGKTLPLKCSTQFRGPFNDSADVEFSQPGKYGSIAPAAIYVNP